MKFSYFIIQGGFGMDKIFQTAVACNSSYGLIAMICVCITLIILVFIIIHNTKAILLESIRKYNSIHAKFCGTSIQTEIDVHDKAA